MDSGISMLSDKARLTAKRYHGDTVTHYERRRSGSAKWAGEDRIVREFLSDLPQETKVLDIPCGTGRFFSYYAEFGLDALGMDISPDMLTVSQDRGVEVRKGSIFQTGLDDGVFDVALSIRFMNLIEAGDMVHALKELQRVARHAVVFTLRVRQPNPSGHYHSAHSLDCVESALLPGWSILRNDAVHEEDYRMIFLCGG